MDVNLDKPMKSHATLSSTISLSVSLMHTRTHTHTHTHTHNLYRIGKQILSKTLLLQEIVKALASLSEYVVFVNT